MVRHVDRNLLRDHLRDKRAINLRMVQRQRGEVVAAALDTLEMVGYGVAQSHAALALAALARSLRARPHILTPKYLRHKSWPSCAQSIARHAILT